MSYNSYLICDEKIAILDTVDESVRRSYIETLTGLLDGQSPDYLIIHHMEPDHCACVMELLEMYPTLQPVGTKKAIDFIRQFYGKDYADRAIIVKDRDTLSLGEHTLHIATMPMVHWPEVIATFEEKTGILFSADAFGSFAPVTGNLYYDEILDHAQYLDEARRYYVNIIGKYGRQVAHALKKIAQFEIQMIAPLHGVLLRGEAVSTFIKLYEKWALLTPQDQGVVILFCSMYGNTERAVQYLAARLGEQGVKGIKMIDLTQTDLSYATSALWRFSHFVLAAPTYNLSLFPKMDALLHDLALLDFHDRKGLVIGNHSWASAAMKTMVARLAALTNVTLVSEPLDIRSSVTPEDLLKLDQMAITLAQDIQSDTPTTAQ